MWIAIQPLGLEATHGPFLTKAFTALAALLVMVFFVRLVDGMAEYIHLYVKRTDTALDNAVVPAMRTAAKISSSSSRSSGS